jgi:hypothetical protein
MFVGDSAASASSPMTYSERSSRRHVRHDAVSPNCMTFCPLLAPEVQIMNNITDRRTHRDRAVSSNTRCMKTERKRESRRRRAGSAQSYAGDRPGKVAVTDLRPRGNQAGTATAGCGLLVSAGCGFMQTSAFRGNKAAFPPYQRIRGRGEDRHRQSDVGASVPNI